MGKSVSQEVIQRSPGVHSETGNGVDAILGRGSAILAKLFGR